MTALADIPLLQVAAAFVAGLVLGFLHFGTLRAITIGYLDGHPVRAIVLQVGRLAVMFAALYGFALLGAAVLLAAAVGVLAARMIVVGRVRRQT
ncbi:MAG: hypothetical protein KDJ77_17905 [Rhodobiaceae bacterium]|nr:hypothetical protein [Rhodobiaceae bacterium]